MARSNRPIVMLGILGWLVSIPVFGQGPGGYTPPGQGVDLSGNWGPVFLMRMPMSVAPARNW